MKHTNKLITHLCLSVSICPFRVRWTRSLRGLALRIRQGSWSGSKRGTILVLVMIITAMIAGMAIAYVATTTSQEKMVSVSIDNISYEQAALSGFEMARAYLLS
ncbi:MAG: hypothetical protein AAB038_00040, partial [Planctomycetota bacterium]